MNVEDYGKIPKNRRGARSWVKRHGNGEVTYFDTNQSKWVRTREIPEDQLMSLHPVERCRVKEHLAKRRKK